MSRYSDRTVSWRRSRYCADLNCVEVAGDGDDILVRSTRRPAHVLRFAAPEWRAFTAAAKRGEFDF